MPCHSALHDQVLGAIKIAVLAPCVKLSIAGEVVMRAGDVHQVDFVRVREMLENAVLARCSQVQYEY